MSKKKIKSPFYIVDDFLSPLACEEILLQLDFIVPDMNQDDEEVFTSKTHEGAEQIVFERLLQIIPDIEEHYGLTYRGTERVNFEWFPEGSEGEAHAENSNFLRGKWLRTKQRDLTAVLFLSDYHNDANFDEDYEVYGGKLEFPQHKFGFNPKRGTLVVYPSAPHFINATSKVIVGDLFQARLHIATEEMFIYQPSDYPGNYTMWFEDR